MDVEDNRHMTDAAAIIDAVKELSEAEPFQLGDYAQDRTILVIPEGKKVVALKPYVDAYRKVPERITGTASLTTLASFIKHVQRFKRSTSAIFATPQSLLAVYDYHGGNDGTGTNAADNCKHGARYAFPYSLEWRAWTQVHGKELTQKAFAEFIEEHISDIAAPKDTDATQHFGELGFTLAQPSGMLAMSRGLLVRVESEAVSRPNLSTGEIEVSYKEQHADSSGAPLKVPGGFMLLIPPHQGGPLYRIPVRLRYRVSGGKVLWTLLMYRTDAVIADAVKDACEQVFEATQVPQFHGEPEGAAEPF